MDLVLAAFGGEGRRTPFTHPYNYDPFPTFICENYSQYATNISRSTIYSDRLRQWDWDKYNELCRKHFGDEGHYWDQRKPEAIEAFLRDWTDNPNLKLLMIEQQCNHATGYPLWRFDFTANAG